LAKEAGEADFRGGARSARKTVVPLCHAWCVQMVGMGQGRWDKDKVRGNKKRKKRRGGEKVKIIGRKKKKNIKKEMEKKK
jgi:hypothetical protein